MQIRAGNTFIKDDAAFSAILYIVFYVIIIFISFALLILAGVSPSEAISGTVSSFGNAGPALDTLSTMGNYSAQPAMAKLIYSVDMILGRLEIYPVFIVLSFIFRRAK